MDNIIIISTILIALAIILMMKAIKGPINSKDNKKEIIEIQQLRSLKSQNPKKELEQIVFILKSYLKTRYNLNTKLSLEELAIELKKQKETRLEAIFHKIKKNYYTNIQTTRNENKKIKESLIDSINQIENHKEKEYIKKKKNETLIEKIQNKQEKIKEGIRVQKILHSKLKNKNRKNK